MSALEEQTYYLLNRRLGWSKYQCGHSEDDKITVTVRNEALEHPAHNIATILTDASQLFSTNMKGIFKCIPTNLQQIPCISPE